MRRGAWMRLGAIAIGAGVVALSASAIGEEKACGKPGQKPCPLQEWMRIGVSGALASNDAAELAAALERSAVLAPDSSWSSWATIAKGGAAAARKGDVAGARAACKACHDTWREAYREKHRGRLIAP